MKKPRIAAAGRYATMPCPTTCIYWPVLPPTVRVSDFIGQVKGATAHRVNELIKPRFKLTWQTGYGVLTLRKDEVEGVSRYIDNQESHHNSGKLSVLLERTEGDEASPDLD